MAEPVAVVGVGAGGLQGLAEEARALVGRAEVLIAGRRHHAWLADHPAERHTLGAGLAALDAAAAAWLAGRRVVVLATGDPGFFGVAAALRRRLGRDAVRVLPAVSSVQLAFARAGLSWEDALFLSAHGRPAPDVLRRALAGGWTKLAILVDAVNSPPRLAAGLIDGGLADCRAVVGERLGADDERVVETTLSSLAHMPPGAFDPLSVLVLERPAVRREPLFGRPDSAYAHDRGMITKAEVRAVGLSKLALGWGDTVWDVGSGSGSVAVEASGLVGEGRVFAVERGDTANLRENVRRFGAWNVAVVQGEAPESLTGLADPDAVFLGGSGGRLAEILDRVQGRLRPGGRLVAHFAVVEHLMLFRSRIPWPQEVVEISAARGEQMREGLRFAALNRVLLASAVKPS